MIGGNMEPYIQSVNGFVWGVPCLLLTLGVGLYLSARTSFAQIRMLPGALRTFFCKLKPAKSSGISSFQALCTALAATVGTGNVAGVAGAIAIGGPGAIFWMWISAFLGMIVKCSEATLAVRFRETSADGEQVGGPMQMIRNGLGKRWRPLAVLYALMGVFAAFGVGNATQINAVISGAGSILRTLEAEASYGVELLIAFILAGVVAMVMLGGMKRIGNFASVLVPFSAVAYLLFCAGVIVLRADRVLPALRTIVVSAFLPSAMTGGFIGSAFLALRTGVSRGVFTNEAGMGTAAMAHACADVSHPCEQGRMGIVEVFLDTMVICTMTALVILCSGVSIPYGLDEGAALTIRAFSAIYGDWVHIPITIFLASFAFATMIGWGLYGVRCAQYLFGQRALMPFVALQFVVTLLAARMQTSVIWLLAETVNGLMAIPNLLAIIRLSPIFLHLIQEYTGGKLAAPGGTYESFNQCKSLRTFSYAEVSSAGSGCRTAGNQDSPSEYRTAGHPDPHRIL